MNAPIPLLANRLGRAHLSSGGALELTQDVRFAGLVDIENALIGRDRLLPPVRRREVFESLDPYLVGIPVRVASGPWAVRACIPELASRGWGLTLVSTRPDAADRALIGAGLQLAASGVTDLVIVSGDHAFASLASVARLHVIARRECLSRQLRLAATTITYLPAPPNHTHEIA